MFLEGRSGHGPVTDSLPPAERIVRVLRELMVALVTSPPSIIVRNSLRGWSIRRQSATVGDPCDPARATNRAMADDGSHAW